MPPELADVVLRLRSWQRGSVRVGFLAKAGIFKPLDAVCLVMGVLGLLASCGLPNGTQDESIAWILAPVVVVAVTYSLLHVYMYAPLLRVALWAVEQPVDTSERTGYHAIPTRWRLRPKDTERCRKAVRRLPISGPRRALQELMPLLLLAAYLLLSLLRSDFRMLCFMSSVVLLGSLLGSGRQRLLGVIASTLPAELCEIPQTAPAEGTSESEAKEWPASWRPVPRSVLHVGIAVLVGSVAAVPLVALTVMPSSLEEMLEGEFASMLAIQVLVAAAASVVVCSIVGRASRQTREALLLAFGLACILMVPFFFGVEMLATSPWGRPCGLVVLGVFAADVVLGFAVIARMFALSTKGLQSARVNRAAVVGGLVMLGGTVWAYVLFAFLCARIDCLPPLPYNWFLPTWAFWPVHLSFALTARLLIRSAGVRDVPGA